MRHCIGRRHFPINCRILPQADAALGTVFLNMTTAIYSQPLCKQHEMGACHPESPSRLQMIEDHFVKSGTDAYLDFRLAPEATIEDLLRAHTQSAVDLVRENTPAGHGDYHPVDTDTLLDKFSGKAALRAAGQISNAFCLSRPIGHHATPATPMEFCLFDNYALAARYAMERHGLQRVAIVDFDVHHGDGTEEAFLDDPWVLMVSFLEGGYALTAQALSAVAHVKALARLN